MNYLLVLGATVLLAFEFALSKSYQAREGVSLAAGLGFNALNGLFTAIIFFGLSGFRVTFSPFSAALAAAMSLCAALYSILGFRVLRSGNMAVYSVFLMSGGMLLPYVFGILFLDEPLTAPRLVGLLMILGAVILSNGPSRGIHRKQLLLCCGIFLLNGAVSIISKVHQVGTRFGPVDSTAFVMYSALGRWLFSSIALAFCRKGMPIRRFSSGKTLWIIAGAALIGGTSYMLQLIGASALPASVLYPLVTGGSIIFSALSGMVFFQEKPTKYQLISIIACFAGTLFFL